MVQSGQFRTFHAENINGNLYFRMGKWYKAKLAKCNEKFIVFLQLFPTVVVLRFDLIPKVLQLPKPSFHLTLVIWNIFSFKPGL